MEQNQTNFNQPANQPAGANQAPIVNSPAEQLTAKMPGVIALFKESLNVYKVHFSSLISISLLFLLGTFFSVMISRFEHSSIFLLFSLILAIGLIIFTSVFIPLALMVALRSLMAGERVQITDSLKSTSRLIIPAIGINILSGLIVIGATIPLLIPGIIVGILLLFSLFSLVIDGQRGLNALMRSRHLVKGNVSAVFWRTFVFGLVIGLPFVFFPMIASVGFHLPETTEQIVNGFLTVLIFPLSIIYSFLIFRFLAKQRPLENFNPQEKRGFYKGLLVWGPVAVIILITAVFLLFSGVFWSLSKARLSTQDARIVAAFSQIRIQTEIYFDKNSTYISIDDFDRHPEIRVFIEDINASGGEVKWGMITPDSYIVWSPLVSKPNWFYCVDSTGDACELDHEPEGGERAATKCGCPAVDYPQI